MKSSIMIGAALALLSAANARAHVVWEQPRAPANSYFKGVLHVSHGCEGSPTVKIRLRIPEGIISARPQPKPGWQLTIQRKALAQPIASLHGKSVTEVVSEIVWSGGPLAADQFDEFRVLMRLPDRANATLHFPVIQECSSGEHQWIEVPAGGQSARDLKSPAPALMLVPKP